MAAETLQRILLIDDEPDIQVVAQVALESLGGFTLESCSSGAEALEKAAAFGPQLILLDVMMPAMDGPTTLEALRRVPQLATVPVVFLTAKAQPREIDRLRALGALDVVAKPFAPSTLADILRAIWNTARR